MRLIDADELLQEFEIETNIHKDNDCGFWHWSGIKSMIKRQPTSYDVEAVVKELEDLKFSYFFTLANTGEAVNDFAYKNVGNAIDKAIEIVKGGVK